MTANPGCSWSLCRDGNAPSPQLAEVIRRTCEEAKALVSAKQVAAGLALTVGGLQERIDNIRGAVTMAYPMGLPEWDPVRLLIEDPKDEFLQVGWLAGRGTRVRCDVWASACPGSLSGIA